MYTVDGENKTKMAGLMLMKKLSIGLSYMSAVVVDQKTYIFRG
jgi:hypothetical protein